MQTQSVPASSDPILNRSFTCWLRFSSLPRYRSVGYTQGVGVLTLFAVRFLFLQSAQTVLHPSLAAQ